MHRWNSWATVVKWNLVSIHLDIVLVLVHGRCTICAKHTMGSEIISDRLEIVLVLVQDRCMVCAKLTIGSEIILDTPDGTPRC
jgi:hypothetical protein